MIRSLVVLLSLALLSACSPDTPPTAKTVPDTSAPVARAAPQPVDIANLLASLRLSGSGLSPDGSKVLFSSNASGVINLYSVPVGGGAPTPLSNSTTNAVYALRYFPGDERLLHTSDQGGNELNHVYVREVDGRVRDLTPGKKLKAQFMDFSDDDKTFFISTNERDQRYFDIYEYRSDDYSRTLLFQNDSGFFPSAVSRDKRFIALDKSNTTNDSDIYL